MAAVNQNAPTSEIGAVTGNGIAVMSWGTFMDQSEKAAELLWPRSVDLYDLMRKDGQIKALLNGMILPITRYNWMIDANGASPEVVNRLAEDLNLPIRGQEPRPVGRSRRRFKFREHLKLTLRTGLVYGHSFSEKVGEYDEEGWWRLRKLGARMPKTITEIKNADDGGLKWIKQNLGPDAKRIPVEHLACWVWEQDPGSWVGESFLRPMYKHWLRKDRLLRVDAMSIEKNGMGVPMAVAPQMATKGAKRNVLAALRRVMAGKDSGLVLETGWDAKFKGVEGTLPDAIKSIQYDDEQMARTALMMFAQLGQGGSSGNRALGETFVDFFALAQDACAYWYADTFNEHVIEDWVDINVGEDENAPLLVFERDSNPELAIADLKLAADAGFITMNHETKAWFADKHGLPEPEEEEDTPDELEPPVAVAPVSVLPVAPEPDPTAVAAERRSHGSPQTYQSPAGRFALPARKLRRAPFEHEILAEVDFDAMEAEYETTVDAMIKAYGPIRTAQIDEVVEGIIAALDTEDIDEGIKALVAVGATPAGQAELMEIVGPLVESASEAAVAEGLAQGLDVSSVDVAAALEKVEARVDGLVRVMANEFAAAATRQALNRTGGSLSAAEIGAQVKEHLEGLSDSYLKDQFGGVTQTAINSGRVETYLRNANFTRLYASELLDRNTCPVCANKDGEEYTTVDSALVDYPSGGYVSCQGGIRCRGTLVGVGDEA